MIAAFNTLNVMLAIDESHLTTVYDCPFPFRKGSNLVDIRDVEVVVFDDASTASDSDSKTLATPSTNVKAADPG